MAPQSPARLPHVRLQSVSVADSEVQHLLRTLHSGIWTIPEGALR